MRLRPASALLARLCAASLLLVAAASPLLPSLTGRVAAAGDCTVDATLDSDEKAFLTLINNYRAQNGLGALTVSYTLTRSSAWKSKDMAANAYFAHDDLSRTWVQRVRDCGYGFNTYIGENIAAGYPTAQAVFDGWKASPGHNANMLGANYTTIGIGKYTLAGSPFGTYWSTDFGGFSDGWVDATGGSSTMPITAPPDPAPSSPGSDERERRHHVRPVASSVATASPTPSGGAPWWVRLRRHTAH